MKRFFLSLAALRLVSVLLSAILCSSPASALGKYCEYGTTVDGTCLAGKSETEEGNLHHYSVSLSVYALENVVVESLFDEIYAMSVS